MHNTGTMFGPGAISILGNIPEPGATQWSGNFSILSYQIGKDVSISIRLLEGVPVWAQPARDYSHIVPLHVQVEMDLSDFLASGSVAASAFSDRYEDKIIGRKLSWIAPTIDGASIEGTAFARDSDWSRIYILCYYRPKGSAQFIVGAG
jgi:hypothetical protein